MHAHWTVLIPLLTTGCATHPRATVAFTASPPVVIAAQEPSRLVETRYEVRGYREAAAPDLRHEPHAVFRHTRVPANSPETFETAPRATAPRLTDAPLPASEELAAELATQKTVTAELRALQTSMADTEHQMQAQYAQLVRQSAEVLKMRDQLEAERQRAFGPAPGTAPAQPTASGSSDTPPEVKW